MKNHIQNIELINSYLNKSLSEKESIIFENRLKTDLDFKELFEQHSHFLEGLKRRTLKAEIRSAKRYHIKMKWFKYLGLCSIIILLITAIYFSIVNSDKDYLKSKLNFEAEYLQKFQVAVDSIVKITGEKGTVIQFNPKDLQTISNKPFFGDMLQVELIELTTKQDLLLANTQTISNGKWLISGGAFKIDIKANGETLVLKEGKTIHVKFPKNTSVDGMQIFYGERDALNNMNWNLSNTKLAEETYHTIFYRDTAVADVELARKFGVDFYKHLLVIDTLGHLSLTKVVEKFPELKEIQFDKDTLRLYDVNFFDYEASSNNLFDEITNNFYDSVELSKLGWINIDKFAPNEEKVNIKLNFNLYTNYNEIYIVDERNNTVLNVFEKEIDIPVGRSFYIIAIGINGKDMYGYKKSVRFEKNGEFNIEFKRINENKIKSIFKL